jgi:uncharacterized repeat protein (TIGR02543 family)
MNKRRLLTLFFIALLLVVSSKNYAQTTITVDDVTFDAVNGIIEGYSGSATDIIIPESFTVNETEVTITEIQYYAFQNKGLTNVSFPNTITSIGFLAFYNNSLTSVSLPTSLTELGNGAFTKNAITEIDGEASDGIFFGLDENGDEDNTQIVCYGGTATDIDFIPSTVTSIQSNAFKNCSLTSVDIPDGVETISSSAFEDNELTSLVLPNSITLISSSAFKSNLLSSVTLSESLTNIAYYAFEDNQLTSIVIPEGVTTIQNDAFEDNLLTSVSLPSSLTEIYMGAFKNNALTSISLPSQLEEIGSNAFYGNSLTSITIPASVTVLNTYAFSTNTLSSVTFEANSNISTIGSHVFYGNTSLSSIEMPTHADDLFDSYVDGDGTEYQAGESISVYTTSYRAKIVSTLTADDVTFDTETGSISEYLGTATDIIIPESFTIDGSEYTVYKIANEAFELAGLSSVDLPETLVEIGDQGFYNNSLSSISIPEGCELGATCFSRNNLTSLSLPASLTEIPSSCFSYNDITELIIPATVKTIGTSAFYYNEIATLTLNEGLEEIGISAFYINNLTSLTIPNSVTLVNRSAFLRNDLTEVNYNESTELRGGAFANNEITTVNGEDSDGVFYGLNEDGSIDYTKLTSYGGTESVIDFLSNSITVIDTSAFSQTRLTSIDLPDALTHIYSGAFYQTYVDEVSFSSTLKYIGRNAFSYNDIETITFPASIEYIYQYAFNQGDLTSVTFESPSNIKFIEASAFTYNSGLDDPIIMPTSGLSGFINYYDEDGNICEEGSGFLDNDLDCFARYQKTLTIDDIVFDETTGTITDYIGDATDIIIPESFTVDGTEVSVVAIGDYAFNKNDLFSVEMANSIITIGDDAFANNSFMESVVLSDNLVTIGDDAFGSSVPDDGIALPNTGTWHASYFFTTGTVITEITATYSYRYIHQVYDVNFVDYDATILETETVVYSLSATAPDDPTRTGYTFTGWDVDYDNITADLTVTAEYSVNTYTVTFQDYDGTLIESQSVDYGSEATAPDDPTRSGYTFTGWDVEFDNITADITVTAVYDISTTIEVNTTTQFIVYPNPVVNTLYVNIENTQEGIEHQISIYNISGQLVYSNSGYGTKKTISVGDLNKGIYYITIDNNKGNKFIKL